MHSNGLRPRRQASRTIGTLVLALEGEIGGKEHQYFSAVRQALASHKPHWLRIVSLPTPSDTHASAPKWVIQRLDDHVAKQRRMRAHSSSDMLWLVFDIDAWEPRDLSAVCKAAAQKRYNVASSNPCFELWLLLHFEQLTPEEIMQRLSRASSERQRSRRAKQLLSEHAKPLDYVGIAHATAIGPAMRRSEALLQRSTPKATARWPDFPGTLVHRIFRELEHRELLPDTWRFPSEDLGTSDPTTPN